MRGAHKANNGMRQAFGSPWKRRWMGWLEPVPRCSWWRHQMETFSALLDFVQRIHRSSVNPVYIDGIVITVMWPGMEKQHIQRCWYRILSCCVLEWLLYQFSQESRGPLAIIFTLPWRPWPLWRFKSPTTRLFIQLFPWVNIDEISVTGLSEGNPFLTSGFSQRKAFPFHDILTRDREDLMNTSSHYNDVIMSGMASQITSLAIVYPTVHSGAGQRKIQSSASLAFVSPVNSPHNGPVTRKIFPFDDVIMELVNHRWCQDMDE